MKIQRGITSCIAQSFSGQYNLYYEIKPVQKKKCNPTFVFQKLIVYRQRNMTIQTFEVICNYFFFKQVGGVCDILWRHTFSLRFIMGGGRGIVIHFGKGVSKVDPLQVYYSYCKTHKCKCLQQQQKGFIPIINMFFNCSFLTPLKEFSKSKTPELW